MYVIQYYNKTGSTVASAFDNDTTHYIPADMCAFQTVATSGGGYELSRVIFFGGNAAGVDLTPLADDNNNATYAEATLGYMGKSGRFVAITNKQTSGLDA